MRGLPAADTAGDDGVDWDDVWRAYVSLRSLLGRYHHAVATEPVKIGLGGNMGQNEEYLWCGTVFKLGAVCSACGVAMRVGSADCRGRCAGVDFRLCMGCYREIVAAAVDESGGSAVWGLFREAVLGRLGHG